MRLIDADRLKEVLDRNFSHTGGAEVMCQIIDKQPTAYDIDKVVEQLRRQVDQHHRRAKEAGLAGYAYESSHNFSKACSYECALEIVRGERI